MGGAEDEIKGDGVGFSVRIYLPKDEIDWKERLMGYTRKVTVDWSYPREFDSAYDSDKSYGQGLYQITRKFGENEKLLYIGIVKSPNRDFYKRITEHLGWLNDVRGQKFFRFGSIMPCQGLTIDEQLIEEVESVVIYESQPEYNEMKKNDYSTRHPIEVMNTGNYGFLPKLIDSNEH